MNNAPHAEQVRMVAVQWNGRREIMTFEEAEELRAAIGRAVTVGHTTTKHIIWTVCDYFNLPMSRVMSDCRTYPIATARHFAMYFINELTQLTLDEIGALFPKDNGRARDHGTICHACASIRTRCATNNKMASDCANLQQLIHKQ